MNLSKQEQAVYDVIQSHVRITQLEISRSNQWLGSHPKHEEHLNIDHQQSTLRKVRQIIRDLKINHGVMILSDRNGYWIAKDRAEIVEYLTRIEKTAKAQAAAWFRTYKAMKNNYGVESDYFNKQGKLFNVTADGKKTGEFTDDVTRN